MLGSGSYRRIDPGRNVDWKPLLNLPERKEGDIFEFLPRQVDALKAVERSAVEGEVDQGAGPLPCGRRPVHDEKITRIDSQPQFLADLAGACFMRILVLFDVPAWEGPVIAVRGFHE
jgi:hypothetical protein